MFWRSVGWLVGAAIRRRGVGRVVVDGRRGRALSWSWPSGGRRPLGAWWPHFEWAADWRRSRSLSRGVVRRRHARRRSGISAVPSCLMKVASVASTDECGACGEQRTAQGNSHQAVQVQVDHSGTRFFDLQVMQHTESADRSTRTSAARSLGLAPVLLCSEGFERI